MKLFTLVSLFAVCFSLQAKDDMIRPIEVEDKRVEIELSKEEKAFVLERMRRMLETLTAVQQALILDMPENTDNLVGNLVSFVDENYPKGWYDRMPESFKAMEDRLNKRWEILAVETSDPRFIQENTVQVMATCNACHRSFKIKN